ncbi:Uncharacterized protein PBTT_05906 [Plasmodiophora brassicae]
MGVVAAAVVLLCAVGLAAGADDNRQVQVVSEKGTLQEFKQGVTKVTGAMVAGVERMSSRFSEAMSTTTKANAEGVKAIPKFAGAVVKNTDALDKAALASGAVIGTAALSAVPVLGAAIPAAVVVGPFGLAVAAGCIAWNGVSKKSERTEEVASLCSRILGAKQDMQQQQQQQQQQQTARSVPSQTPQTQQQPTDGGAVPQRQWTPANVGVVVAGTTTGGGVLWALRSAMKARRNKRIRTQRVEKYQKLSVKVMGSTAAALGATVVLMRATRTIKRAIKSRTANAATEQAALAVPTALLTLFAAWSI